MDNLTISVVIVSSIFVLSCILFVTLFAIFRRRNEEDLELVVPLVDKNSKYVGTDYQGAATLETMQEYQILLGTEIMKVITHSVHRRSRK